MGIGFTICKHNLKAFEREPSYLIIGIKTDGSRSLPPRYENVEFTAMSENEVFEKTKDLIVFKVCCIGEVYLNESTIREMSKEYFKTLKTDAKRKQYEELKKEFEP